MTTHRWTDGNWNNPPASIAIDDDDLVVVAVKGSDAWRETAHGYVTDNAHSLLRPMSTDTSVEVTFVVSLTEQFDQAGIMLRSDAAHWIKAGAEFADGTLQLGAVVTSGASDWSSAPVPDWAGRTVTMSATRTGNAVLIRARVDDEPFRLIRTAWFDPTLPLAAGPYVAAPTRAGLEVRFTRWQVAAADAVVHPDGLPEFD